MTEPSGGDPDLRSGPRAGRSSELRPGLVPGPGPETWTDALLTSGSEALLNAVRNYIGPVRTPYDKHDLVRRLESFVKRKESQDSLVALLDPIDARIVGTSLLLGPAAEHELKDLFVGEIALFDLGVRIANLYDRLILFRYATGEKRLVAVNPLLAGRLAMTVLDPGLLFSDRGMGEAPAGAADEAVPQVRAGGACDARHVVAFFSFLFHFPGALRKGGGLTKRATEQLNALFADTGLESRLPELARALSAAGLLVSDGENRVPDRAAFRELVQRWGEDLPFYLAAVLAETEERGRNAAEGTISFAAQPGSEERSGGGGRRARIAALASLLAPALRPPASAGGDSPPPGYSRQGLRRWLGLALRRAGVRGDAGRCANALETLGLLREGGEGLVLALPPKSGEPEGKGARIVAEGAHAIHLMPEAGLEDRLFIGSIARPVSLGTLWTFEIERNSVRRGFGSGLSSDEITECLRSLSGAALPQSLTFSLAAWEEEYRALRLYRGVVLVAEERFRPVIEHSAVFGEVVAEVLAPGAYLLSASSLEAAVTALSAVGLEASPRVGTAGSHVLSLGSGSTPGEAGSQEGQRAFSFAEEPSPRIEELLSMREQLQPQAGGRAHPPDPTRRLAELRSALEQAVRAQLRTAAEARELEDRISRRLVLTERQIEEAELRPERLEAGGLDYLGKVRVVERALRSSGDRLELLYRLPGGAPERAVVRPVKLDRNDRGLVLEGEDLATGNPIRVPLGAVSTVRRLRASLFGEET